MDNTYTLPTNTPLRTKSTFGDASRSSDELHPASSANLHTPTSPKATSKTNPLSQNYQRKSVFKEEGLDEPGEAVFASTVPVRPKLSVRFRSTVEVLETTKEEHKETDEWHNHDFNSISSPNSAKLTISTMPRLFWLTLIIAVTVPTLNFSPLIKSSPSPIGAEAGPIDPLPIPNLAAIDGVERRQSASTAYCKRWSQQSALVNGTLYLFGGRATTNADQNSSTWNNDFLTLDLSKTWQISTPTLNNEPQPSDPPPVANGFLWSSLKSLFIYGGEFSDTPVTTPVPFSLWEYDIQGSSWKEHQNPQTSKGDNSDGGGQPVQRAAEGAGLNVPELGRGFFFGGHQDAFTTDGWSIQVARIYLKSMIEFTFPGSSNPSVDGSPAGDDGLWRNITSGGVQDTAGFTERADGVLVYVPGYGKNGIIVGLAGGTADKFAQMNIVDIYDIDSSTWYKQSTSGKTPRPRANPCAVAASAADGTSTQIYMYSGQALQPAGSQEQYDDLWILSVPSFTWISVDTSSQASPPPRSGHTCNIWNSQMVVVGGYVGTDLACDSPGIYVFDTSGLSWVNNYTALEGANDLNQQDSQKSDNRAVSGSFEYQVPKQVQSIIGGNDQGAATVTKPIQSATTGPLATGKPITYTVTGPGGVVTTTSNPSSQPGAPQSSSDKSGPNVGAIVAGVIAGSFAILAAYLGFCAYLYRRQLHLYKNHVAMVQRSSMGLPSPADKTVFAGYKSSQDGSSPSRYHKDSTEQSSHSGGRVSARAGAGYTQIPHMSGATTSRPSAEERRGRVGGDHSSTNSSQEDFLMFQEPSFVGVLLNPRRSLRVINRD